MHLSRIAGGMSLRMLAVRLVLLAAAAGAAACSGQRARHERPAPTVTVAGADLAHGKAVFETECAACHGERGTGGPVGPSLRSENRRRTYRSVYSFIRDPAPPMPKLYPSRLRAGDLRDVSAYVESL